MAQKEAEPQRIPDYRRRWALVVGVASYENGFEPLRNAGNDACLIYRLLTADYGFTGRLLCSTDAVAEFDREFVEPPHASLVTETVGNGSQADIIDAIDEIARKAGPEDLFVFFYAGHGTNEGRGYMVPYGARADNPASYLMYETFFGALSALPCKHKILFFDCCFAGIATRGEYDIRVMTEAHEHSRGFNSAPSTADQIVLGDQLVVIAATNAFSTTPDNFQDFEIDGRRSKNSAFTYALEECLQRLSMGDSLIPETIFSHIFNRVTQELLTDIRPLIQPRIFTYGSGQIVLYRPGLQIVMRTPLRLQATPQGQIHREPLRVSGGNGSPTWAIEREFENVWLEKDQLCIDAIQLEPGKYVFPIRVTDASKRSTTVEATVFVSSQETRPPDITTMWIEPYLYGQNYRAALRVQDGEPPFRWQLEGLPSGFTVSPRAEADYEGTITIRDVALSDPNWQADHRLTHIIRITVTDAQDRVATRRLRLLRLDPEIYCEVAAGRFCIGYHRTPERTAELNRRGISTADVDRAEQRQPRGEVDVPGFFIKRYPVTNREWAAFVESTRHPNFPRRWSDDASDNLYDPEREADLPVSDLSYDDIMAYCEWRGTRLPSAWEWEKAARGTDTRLYPWGERLSSDRCNCWELLWIDKTLVAQFPRGASPYGVMDMVGNLWECVRHRWKDGQTWRQGFRGGSYLDDGLSLLCCFSSEYGIEMEPDAWGQLVASQGSTKLTLRYRQQNDIPIIGFRDAVEVKDTPSYAQDLVPLDASQFVSPSSGEGLVTSQYYIARYAVSNEEYAEFVAASGHPPPIHWQDSAHDYFPFEDRYLPVVNVSIDDVKAFCTWKSKQLGITIQPLTKRIWQTATHGPGDQQKGFVPRLYPWGAEYGPLKCNSQESGWGGVVRVFDLPEGLATCGAYNLIGNVAEWAWVGRWIVVGGSWLNRCHDTKSWYQDCNGPRYDIGFRYCSEEGGVR